MLGQLKDRFLSLQEEISASVKSLAPNDQTPGISTAKRKDLEAGSALLETWQNNWEDLHIANERNAKSANRCDKLIQNLKSKSVQKKMEVVSLVNEMPKVNRGIQEIMLKLGALESLLGDVEIGLLALEDTIDAREMQEKQLEQRFQLAMYQERRKAEFNELATRLQSDYERKKKRKMSEERQQKQQKQEYYQKKFEDDVEKYKNQLRVPCRHDPDASLESVDLDDPLDLGEDKEATEKTLEAFFNDALYDVSPLPRDETPISKVENVEDIPCEIPINVITANSSPPTVDIVTPPAGASMADSMYFTPDVTTDKLSEINLDD